MDLNSRVVKTPKGDEELKLRMHRLGKNERLALILVDGRSTVEQVLKKAGGATHLQESLDTLAAEGFIISISPQDNGGYADLKRQLVAIAHEVFGDKSAKVVSKIEAAGESPDGLAEGVSAGRKIAQLIIDEGKAGVFASRCEQLIASH